MMKLKIYTVHHAVPRWYMANETLVPFIVGDNDPAAYALTTAEQRIIQTDREPPTLSAVHSLAEMRCHYWVWKHLPDAVDYVGFQHYRRAFVSALSGGGYAELRADREYFMRRGPGLTASWLRGLLDHCDIIVPRKWPAEPDLGTDYGRSHSEADWQVLLGSLPAVHQVLNIAGAIGYIYRANMFVMRRDLFNEYMGWWDPIMTKVAATITPPAEGYQSRTFGFMSERLFTMWVTMQRVERPELRIIELPMLVGSFTEI